MAELKTRILLRNDILANWESVNPILGKGELAVVFDPTVSGDGRTIRAKIGDGVTAFNQLPYIGGEASVSFADLTGLARDNEDLKRELEALEADINARVEKELQGSKGKAIIFNEEDGGGSKFEGANGVVAYVGTHDSIGGEIGTQIYVDKAGGEESTIIDVTQNGAYYTKGVVKPGVERDVEANEIAVKGDLTSLQGIITAALELKADKSYVDEELGKKANAADVYTKDETDSRIDEKIAEIKHWSYKVVDVLPETGEENIIYLVSKGEGKVGYKEYIWIKDHGFEEIGDTDIDLSDYRKAEDQDKIDEKKLEAYNITVDGAAGKYVGEANVPVYFELASDGENVSVNAYNITLNTTKEQTAFVSSMAIPNATEENTGLLSKSDYAKFEAKQDAITIINCGGAAEE